MNTLPTRAALRVAALVKIYQEETNA